MPDPAQTAVTATGITVSGVALGLHPALLLAGFCGSMWSLSLCDPMPALRRMTISGVSTFVAGYATPAVVAVAHSATWWPAELTADVAQYLVAMLIGFLSHQVIGPALLKIAARKMGDGNGS